MTKVIILLFLFHFSQVYAADWKLYGTDLDGNKNYYDASTVKYREFGKVEAWIKEYRNTEYAISNINVDCDADTYFHTNVYVFDKYTNKSKEYKLKNFPVIKPQPDSIGYAGLRAVCEHGLATEFLKEVVLPKRSNYSTDEEFMIAAFNSLGLDYSKSNEQQINIFNNWLLDFRKKQIVYKSSLNSLKVIRDLRKIQKEPF